jgi:hypothetical protein
MTTIPAVPSPHRPRSLFTLVVTVVGLAGIAAVFLPFTWDTSPIDVVFRGKLQGAWPIAVPLFLPIFAAAVSVRWSTSGTLARWERLVAQGAAIAGGVAIGYYYANLLLAPDIDLSGGSPSDWFVFVTPLAITAAAFVLQRLARRRLVPVPAQLLIALQAVYAADAVICLSAARAAGYQAGAWCVMVTCAVYVVQVLGVLLGARPAPAAAANAGS